MSTSADFAALLLLPLLALLTFFFFFFLRTLLEGTGGLGFGFLEFLVLDVLVTFVFFAPVAFFLKRLRETGRFRTTAEADLLQRGPALLFRRRRCTADAATAFLNGRLALLGGVAGATVCSWSTRRCTPRPPLLYSPQIISEKTLTSSLMAVMSPSQIRLPFRCDMSTRNAVVKALMMSCAFCCSPWCTWGPGRFHAPARGTLPQIWQRTLTSRTASAQRRLRSALPAGRRPI